MQATPVSNQPYSGSSANFDRKHVLRILRNACDRCVNYDYAFGHILHEDDLRASVYGYVRSILDKDPSWRVFCGLNVPATAGTEKRPQKPDLLFFRSKDDHKTEENERVEAIVEFKHWPTEAMIKNDIKKLVNLRKRFKTNSRKRLPTVVFFAILGDDNAKFCGQDAASLERRFLSKNHRSDLRVWLRLHSEHYRGPWNSEKGLDPWRLCLKDSRRRFSHPCL